MVLRKLLLCCLAVLICSCLAGTAFAQSLTTGDVAGVVSDPSGAVIPNVQVTLKDNGTGSTQTANTNASGTYRFTLLRPGSYTISVNQQGFSQVTRPAQISVGQVVTANLQLTVGAASQTVEVTAAAP